MWYLKKGRRRRLVLVGSVSRLQHHRHHIRFREVKSLRLIFVRTLLSRGKHCLGMHGKELLCHGQAGLILESACVEGQMSLAVSGPKLSSAI